MFCKWLKRGAMIQAALVLNGSWQRKHSAAIGIKNANPCLEALAKRIFEIGTTCIQKQSSDSSDGCFCRIWLCSDQVLGRAPKPLSIFLWEQQLNGTLDVGPGSQVDPLDLVVQVGMVVPSLTQGSGSAASAP